MYFWKPAQLPPQYASFARTGELARQRMERGGAEPVSYDVIMRRNIFHAALEPPVTGAENSGGKLSPAEEAAILAEMDRLPVSKQGWTLLGTLVNSLEPRDSRAFMLVGGKPRILRQGSGPGGWKITLIERRAVIVEKNGRREKLLVGGAKIQTPQTASHTENRVSVNAMEIENALNDLPSLMTQAGFSAGQQNGEYGLNLAFIQPDSFLARLGLRQNDFLTRANGQELASLGDLAKLKSLAREDYLRLELKRNGQDMTIEYDINR